LKCAAEVYCAVVGISIALPNGYNSAGPRWLRVGLEHMVR
jgi:hypothetical protein